MVKIICGAKGKGKTKKMLELANQSILKSEGEVVYLDKNGKHMFELNNKIRLINISDYPIDSTDALIGFIAGIIAGNNDIESIYFDSFLKIAFCDSSSCTNVIETLENISKNVEFTVSISADEAEIADVLKEHIVFSC